jgi:hypothetical protein
MSASWRGGTEGVGTILVGIGEDQRRHYDCHWFHPDPLSLHSLSHLESTVSAVLLVMDNDDRSGDRPLM